MDVAVGLRNRVSNQRVLALMKKSTARVIRLIAPAGYGKTPAAESFSEEFDCVSRCDCGEVTSLAEFLSNVLEALARGEKGTAFVHARLNLITAADEPAMLAIFEEVWTRAVERSLIMLENCEQLVAPGELTDLLYRLLVCRSAQYVQPGNRRAH